MHIGTCLIGAFTKELNVHNEQYSEKLRSVNMLKWSDIMEVRNVLGLLVLMGQLQKDNIKDCWSLELTTATLISLQTMGSSHFEAIQQAWY
jgi:hypothetical protein